MRVWDWSTGQPVHTFKHPDWVQGIDWRPDGRVAVTGCGDHQVRLWDLDTGKQCATFSGHEWAVVQVVFSPDAEFLASRGWEGIVRLWDPYTQRELVNKPIYGWINQHFSSKTNQASSKTHLLSCGLAPRGQGLLEAPGGIGYRVLRQQLTGTRGWELAISALTASFWCAPFVTNSPQ